MSTARAPHCLVVLPTYNEKGNVEALAAQLLGLPANIDVIVVDDSSPDGTADLVERLAAGNPRIRLIRRPNKLGLGSAYLAAFEYALARDYDAVCTMDADCSHDPKHLPVMLERLAGADVVIGSRYCAGGRVEHFSAARKINSFVANALARRATGVRVRDATSGYRIYRTEFLRRMPLDALQSHGYSMLVELLYEAKRAGARIVESPIVFKNRASGDSKITFGEIFESLKTFGQIRTRARTSHRLSA